MNTYRGIPGCTLLPGQEWQRDNEQAHLVGVGFDDSGDVIVVYTVERELRTMPLGRWLGKRGYALFEDVPSYYPDGLDG